MAFPVSLTGDGPQPSRLVHTIFTLRKEVFLSFLERPELLEMHFPLRLPWSTPPGQNSALCASSVDRGCASPVVQQPSIIPAVLQAPHPSAMALDPPKIGSLQPALSSLCHLCKGTGQPWLLLPSGKCRAQTGTGEQPRTLGRPFSSPCAIVLSQPAEWQQSPREKQGALGSTSAEDHTLLFGHGYTRCKEGCV